MPGPSGDWVPGEVRVPDVLTPTLYRECQPVCQALVCLAAGLPFRWITRKCHRSQVSVKSSAKQVDTSNMCYVEL